LLVKCQSIICNHFSYNHWTSTLVLDNGKHTIHICV